MIRGSCLCGSVSFEFEEVNSSFRLCHCHRCRKISGSAFYAGFTVKGLRFLSGEVDIRSFEAPVLKYPPAYRTDFCERCGSPVPWPIFESETHNVPAGCLDEDPGVRPVEHVLVECIAPWDKITDQLPQFTEAQVMFQHFKGLEDSGHKDTIEGYEWLLEQFSESSVVDAVKQRLAALKSDDQ